MAYKRIRPTDVVGDKCKGYGPDCVGCVMEHTCEADERSLHEQLEEDMCKEEEALRKMTSSEEKPKLRKIETLYENNRRNVSETLRYIAEHLDKGSYGDMESAVLILRRKPNPEDSYIGSVEVFGIGAGDYDASVTLMSQGLNQLLNETPIHEEDDEES